MYGPTSAYRLAPERADSPSASRQTNGADAPDSPHFEWNRYLPHEAPISRDEHDRYVSILCMFDGC